MITLYYANENPTPVPINATGTRIDMTYLRVLLRSAGAPDTSIVELVRVRHGDDFCLFAMDEDAVRHGLPRNPVGSRLYSKSGAWVSGEPVDYGVCGPIILLQPPARIEGIEDSMQPHRLPAHVLARPGWIA